MSDLSDRVYGATRMPELNFVLFGFLINFPWEILQAPMFDGMPDTPHWEAIKSCTRATVGDVVIAIVAYWCVALTVGTRRWVIKPSTAQVLAFTGIGTSITVIIERLVLNGTWFQTWSYSPLMPMVPFLKVGLTPMLQWIALSPLTIWLVRRQLR